MRFPHRDDPTDIGDPDEQMMIDPVHRKLLWGLAKGAVMAAAMLGLTWVAGNVMQQRVAEEGQMAQARDQTVQPVDSVPANTGATPDGRPADRAAAPR